MNKAVFFRKEPCLEDRLSVYVVERVVVLKQRVYDDFAAHLMDEYDFLWNYSELMHVDEQGVWHCVLVKAEGSRDGILVNSEGASYARYAAYCPNCADVERMVKSEASNGSVPHQPDEEEEKGWYAVYWYDKGGQREEWQTEAVSVEEALGLFFQEHPTLCYDNIFDHCEL